MELWSLESLGIFLRCAAVGQLTLIGALFLRRPLSGKKLAFLAFSVCTAAYLLLTAPIPDVDYGLWRNLLLILTDAWPFALWFSVLYYFDDDFTPSEWPLYLKRALALYALWHLYFFGVLAGQGVFHDISHGLAILILLHLVYAVLRGLNNDLVDARRKTRIPLALLFSAYGIMLASVQLGPYQWRHNELFNLLNAGFIFLSVLVLARSLLAPLLPEWDRPKFKAALPAEASEAPQVPLELRPLKQKLDDFIAAGGYRQSNLSISALAEQLSCPEHHLRRLINAFLGFRNFNAFLNSYRLVDACNQLADASLIRRPILSIALDLGYGSIGPFNRAFKAQLGQTPSDYRRSFRIGAEFS